jgi:hypothetical protein
LRIANTVSPTPPGILIERLGIADHAALFVNWAPLLYAE